VIDASYSLPRVKREQALALVNAATKHMREADRIGIVTFGGDARLAAAPMGRGQIVADLSVPDGSQTNIARALSFALSAFPPEMAKRIVLVSDGNENAGSAVEAARLLAAEDVPVDVVPLGNPLQDEATLDRMLTPPDAKRGEPFAVRVVASSLRGGEGGLRLLRNGKTVAEQRVSLKPGKNVFSIPQKAEQPGFYTYEAVLTTAAGQDSIGENNRAMSFVKVQGKPRILAIEGAPGQEKFLARALQAQKVDVDVRAPGQLPTQMAGLLGYDAVVLSDVPAAALTRPQMHLLQTAVRDLGIGLTMIGGEQSFGAGGYFKTPIEEALPVDMDVRKMRRYPGVALALAIDRSGSMGACHCGGAGERINGGINKTDISREAANRAVEALNAQDQVGVIAVDNAATTVVPLQFATDLGKIKAGIGTIQAGGNTNLAAGVQAAYEMLANADAKIKHAILVTDGWSNKYDYGALIARMRKAKITLTVVAVDEGENLAFLRALEDVAKQTGGRYYLVQDVRQIPKIYTREVQTVSNPRSWKSRSCRASRRKATR
jgi:Mg-chelatase subunit ChlD